MLFHDRTYAAFLLINQLKQYKNCDGAVLAIPRGGVPIGYQIAHLLRFPLDIILCKKIGHPNNPEFAIGAVCADEVIVDTDNNYGVSADFIARQTKILQEEITAKRHLFMNAHPSIVLQDKIVILTDDGIATGNTALACIRSIRKQNPKKIVIAVPVASTGAYTLLSNEVDEFISLIVPRHLTAVGQFYENFSQVSDDEVNRLLIKARSEQDEKVVVH